MGVHGDYDGDGDVDLYVSNLTRNALLRNDGTGRFEDVTEAANADVPAWSASAAFLDVDGDGDLDLFVTNYIEWSTDGEKVCLSPQKARTYCSPKSYDRPARDTLLLNRGDGPSRTPPEASGLDAAFGNGWASCARTSTSMARRDLRRQRRQPEPVLGPRRRRPASSTARCAWAAP